MGGTSRQAALQGRRLRDALRAFPDLDINTLDYERSAELFNTCRRHGVQGSNTDFLICAAADRHRMPILTTDLDFSRFAEHIPVLLHQPRREFTSRAES